MDSKEEDTNISEELKQSHLIKLSELKYNYIYELNNKNKNDNSIIINELKNNMMNIINENSMFIDLLYLFILEMSYFLSTMNKLYNWNEELNETKYSTEVNEEIKLIEVKIENSLKEEGETEVRDALLSKADVYARIGDKV